MIGRVLLIEDDPDVRALACSVLAGEGFDVVGQPLGSSALEWIRATDQLPELVVLDVHMPEMDGWTVLEHLRRDARSRSIPVLMCTGKVGDRGRRPTRCGADGYLPKPFTIDALITSVRKLLELERAAVAQHGRGDP